MHTFGIYLLYLIWYMVYTWYNFFFNFFLNFLKMKNKKILKYFREHFVDSRHLYFEMFLSNVCILSLLPVLLNYY